MIYYFEIPKQEIEITAENETEAYAKVDAFITRNVTVLSKLKKVV